MQRADIHVKLRTETGKGAARSHRREGQIPAVVYGSDVPAQPISVDARHLWQILHDAKGERFLVNMFIDNGNGDNSTSSLTMIKDVQHDPVRGEIEHVDFLRISIDRRIDTTVPIHMVGSSSGVREGGVLEHLLRELHVACLPLEIPEDINVDISDMEIGQSLHVSDLEIQEGIRVLTSPETVIALVAAPTKVAEITTEAATEGEDAEGADEESETSGEPAE